MPTYRIRGIDVDFPFEAYDCQKVYMERVIQALQSKSNALLESPTGTGKTLCLLCASLAWRKSLGDFSRGSSCTSDSPKLPTIVYTSRTHSQLRQVVQELKRSHYRPKMVVLGSREQMCIHEEVSLVHGKKQIHACQYICRKRSSRPCDHFARVNDFMRHNPHLGEEPIDIEDLVEIGKRSGSCPYYVSRELHKDVDIVFAPYNYLIDRGTQKSLKLDWQDCVLIFDEAHNLGSLCAEAASFDLTGALLSACIAEAKTCINIATERRNHLNDTSVNPDNFAILKALLLKLESRIAEVPIQSKELGFTKPGPYIYELLADLNITHKTASKLINMIEEAAGLLEEDKNQKVNDTASRIESISDMLKLIFRDEGSSSHAEFYRVHVREAEANATDVITGKKSRILGWWCFNPGIAMREFSRMGVGSIILTSGTLSPLDSFAHELKLDFPIRLENPHVISSNQLWAGVVPVGPSGCAFNSNYRNRDSLEYKQELGNAIVNFARIVPDGLLVFFPSYYLLDQCIGCWKNASDGNSVTIWDRICKHKKPVIEPRQSSTFLLSIQDYMAKLQDTSSSGAVFLAVCRGKVSEGLDFADGAGRAVVIIGMPFAPMNDPKVRLKREYLDHQLWAVRADSKAPKPQTLTGDDWYNQQASRAVNQAIGRVIRHRHDYGAIIFCDERFMHQNRRSQVSCWIQPYIKCYSRFGEVVSTLTSFFRDEEAHHRPTKLELRQLADRGIVKEEGIDQPVNTFQLNALEDKACPSQLSSSLTEDRGGDKQGRLADILPANRAFLSSTDGKQSWQLKRSSIPLNRIRHMATSGWKDMQNECLEVNDGDNHSLLDQKPTEEELSTLLAVKKRQVMELGSDVTYDRMHRVIKLEANETRAIRKTEERASTGSSQSNSCFTAMQLVKKHKSSEKVGERGSHTSQESSSLLLGIGGRTMQQKEQECRSHGCQGVKTSTASSCSKADASAYLSQVREKLSAAEYEKFLNYMRALKAQVLKRDDAIQSIVELLSGPGRLPLLKRFKDFVPTKYHSIYERCVERCNPST